MDRKSAFCKGVDQYPANFHVEGDDTTSHFARMVSPMNALQLCR